MTRILNRKCLTDPKGKDNRNNLESRRHENFAAYFCSEQKIQSGILSKT